MTQKLTDEQLREIADAAPTLLPPSTAPYLATELLALRAERAKPTQSDEERAFIIARCCFADDVNICRVANGILPIIASIRAEGSAERFKPCVIVDEEIGITTCVFEDVAHSAVPLHDRIPHFIDKLVAWNDGRIVGIQIWMTKPPSAERAKLEAALRPFAEAGKRLPDVWRDYETHWTNWEQSLTAGHLRAARDAVAPPAEIGATDAMRDHERRVALHNRILDEEREKAGVKPAESGATEDDLDKMLSPYFAGAKP